MPPIMTVREIVLSDFIIFVFDANNVLYVLGGEIPRIFFRALAQAVVSLRVGRR